MLNTTFLLILELNAEFPLSFGGLAHYLWKVRDDGAIRGLEELIIDCPRLVSLSMEKPYVKQ